MGLAWVFVVAGWTIVGADFVMVGVDVLGASGFGVGCWGEVSMAVGAVVTVVGADAMAEVAGWVVGDGCVAVLTCAPRSAGSVEPSLAGSGDGAEVVCAT